jgi:hypothetical protein
MRRWVRYEAPIMVCVKFDEDSHNGKVVNVVLASDHEDIALARDYRGQFLVYDQTMNRIEDNDPRPITIADHREWPQPDDWEQGPTPCAGPACTTSTRTTRTTTRPTTWNRSMKTRNTTARGNTACRQPSPNACRAPTDP